MSEDEELIQMSTAPLLVLSLNETMRIAQRVKIPEEIATALWDYAWIAWQRGRQFERALVADRAMRWWSPWWRWGRR